VDRRGRRWRREAPLCPQPTGRGTAAPPCGRFMKQTSSDKTSKVRRRRGRMPNRKDKKSPSKKKIEHKKYQQKNYKKDKHTILNLIKKTFQKLR
jgi:hypothetical protein